MNTEQTFWAIAGVLWVAGIFVTSAVSYRSERHELDGDTRAWFWILVFPLCWVLWIPLLYEYVTDGKERALENKRRMLAGEPPPLTPEEIVSRRKAWKAYYVYAGEVRALGRDFEHPGPHIDKPSFPDPKFQNREHNVWDCAVSKSSRCQRCVGLPEPSRRRYSHLLDTAYPKAAIEKKQRELEKLEHELSGIPETEALIHRIDQELKTKPRSKGGVVPRF